MAEAALMPVPLPMTDSLRDHFPARLFQPDMFTEFLEAVKPLKLSRAHRKQIGRYWRNQSQRSLTADEWLDLVPEEGPRPWPPWVTLLYPQEPEPPEPPESVTHPPGDAIN